MVTKTGKHHFTCTFSTYLQDGTIAYRCENWTFTAKDADSYMQRVCDGYPADMTVSFENLVDLDS